MLQADVAVIERDAPIESLVELDFGACKTEASVLRENLEAPALPLHDVEFPCSLALERSGRWAMAGYRVQPALKSVLGSHS